MTRALSDDERLVHEALLYARESAEDTRVSPARVDAAVAAFERIVSGTLVTEMFEHIIFTHGYMLGLAMRAGKTGAEAWEETAGMRATAFRLGERAGLPVPDYFQAVPTSEYETPMYRRDLADGRVITVYKHNQRQYGLGVGTRDGFIADNFYYRDGNAAVRAAIDWTGDGDAPVGWFRNPQSGRRRPDGDPALEHYQP